MQTDPGVLHPTMIALTVLHRSHFAAHQVAESAIPTLRLEHSRWTVSASAGFRPDFGQSELHSIRAVVVAD